MAHLEQFSPTVLRRLYLGVLFLILLGASIVPLGRALNDLGPNPSRFLRLARRCIVMFA